VASHLRVAGLQSGGGEPRNLLDLKALDRCRREDPHIGGIYGLEDTDGIHAMVLELVDGPTLASVHVHPDVAVGLRDLRIAAYKEFRRPGPGGRREWLLHSPKITRSGIRNRA